MKMASQGGLAVVTGAAGGLGASFAKKLAERGYRLLLVDRRPKELEQVCESLAAQHGICVMPSVIDLCKRKQVEHWPNGSSKWTSICSSTTQDLAPPTTLWIPMPVIL